MSEAGHASTSFWFDEPWRLAWVAPLAVALWCGLLFVFSLLLKQTAAPPPESRAVEARIIELPAPAGLQSSPAMPAPKHAPARPRAPKARPAPLAPPSIAGTAKAAPGPSPISGESDQDSANLGVQGTDSEGARTTYAPAPEIPDDLRENDLNVVAIAHFKVDTGGVAEVSLAQPTVNPRLNEILLDTLRQWRFAPATRGGVAVESAFDIRIPITVQ